MSTSTSMPRLLDRASRDARSTSSQQRRRRAPARSAKPRCPDWMPANSRICSTISVSRRPSPRISSPYLLDLRLVVRRRRRRGCRRRSGSPRAACAARARPRRRTPSAGAPAPARGASRRTSSTMLAPSSAEDAGADEQVAAARGAHRRFERARRVLHEQPPLRPAVRAVPVTVVSADRSRSPLFCPAISDSAALLQDHGDRPRRRRLAGGGRRSWRSGPSGTSDGGQRLRGTPRRGWRRERGEAPHFGDELLETSCSRTWNRSALASPLAAGAGAKPAADR